MICPTCQGHKTLCLDDYIGVTAPCHKCGATGEIQGPKVHVVLFLDGFGGVAHVFALDWELTGREADNWARVELARQRAAFPESAAHGNKALPVAYVVYGCDVRDAYDLRSTK